MNTTLRIHAATITGVLLTAFAMTLAGPVVAALPSTASSINIDGIAVASHEELQTQFPLLSSKEIDRLLFRVADARSMALLSKMR